MSITVEASTRECHLVTGGGGYAGFHLGKTLQQKGHLVVLFDLREPLEPVPDGIRFLKGDIQDYEEVKKAFVGVDCVYHLASYGMSGREQLNKKLIESVNIQGTKNVIKACQVQGIYRLVYTSTYNVVFGGQEIKNGKEENLPYLEEHQHADHYSRTKTIAEQTILAANGSAVCGDRTLRACALRLAGVYGPGEQRHLPRIVSYIKKGLFSLTYGKEDSLVEFLHIDNLVQAHVLAMDALGDQRAALAAGQAYFISDCKPVNNFEFFRPLVEGLGYTYPKIKLPISIIYFFAILTEIVHSIVGRMYNFQPLLTKAEVYKTGVTHYFCIDKAKKDLGYKPTIQNDMTAAVKWFVDRGYHRKAATSRKSYTLVAFLRDLILAAIFAVTILSFLPQVK